jgi:hypothetical protein
MPVQSVVPGAAGGLREHLVRAAALVPDEVARLGAFATQLNGHTVVPIIGAGGSADCGILRGGQVANAMYTEYMSDPGYTERPSNHAQFNSDLGAIADAIYLERTQEQVVEALGLHDSACWPNADDLPAHFCGYRVLARLAREELFSERLRSTTTAGLSVACTTKASCSTPAGMAGAGATMRRWSQMRLAMHR